MAATISLACSHHPAKSNASPAQSAPRFEWPNGARAAVSLTYDDTLVSQRENAVPALDAHGLRGTFFLTGNIEDLTSHRAEWQKIRATGHELASHTMHHPCDRAFDWVKPGFAIQDYTRPRMAAELDETKALLVSLGAAPPYTFAYPCGQTTLGESAQSYVDLVAQRFLAARTVQPEVASPLSDDLHRVPAIEAAHHADKLASWVDEALARGGWLVLFFHGVGGDHLSVDSAQHLALVEYLHGRRESVWVAPFGRVAAHIAARREVLSRGSSG